MRHGRIEVNPAVMLGKPVVKGTRLTAQQIMEEIHGGYPKPKSSMRIRA